VWGPCAGPSQSRDPLEDLDFSEAPEYLHKQIRDMLKTHLSMWDGTIGVIRATEHAIVTPPDALPIRAQPYRNGPFERQIISDQINKMLKLNVIAPSHSAWASPVVIVQKKNGKARFFVDFRRLNSITKKDAYPLPRMEDFLDSLGDALVFTSLDCTAGYWQVPLRKDDPEKPAFTTHCGIYNWLSMPFGLTKAPATFQQALDFMLTGLKWQICFVYSGDVIIFSATAEQHVKDVDTVLHRLREAGVTLNLEKCTWFSDEVEYLGHIVRPGQLHVRNKKVDALKHAKLPTKQTQLKSFLGLCNVYRRLVKDFAKRAKPLNALTRAEIPPDLHRRRMWPSPRSKTFATHCCAHRYLPCHRPTGSSSSTLTHVPTKSGVPSSSRNRANCFILSDIGAQDSLLQRKTTQPRSANASASCGLSSS